MDNLFSMLAGFGAILAILIIWSSIWKGLALWKAAHNNHLGWFIALMIINTAGILEILYIYFFSKKTAESSTFPPQSIDKQQNNQ